MTVIGGGLAGLSSAVALAEAGVRVGVLEKRPHLGGRAASYDLPDGSHVDNCQHITLGCCTNLDDFYRRVGAADKIHYYQRLYLADAQGRRFEIAPSFLPPPFHLALSLLGFRALSFADKRAVARALLLIARFAGRPPDAAGATMLEWLRRHAQNPGAIERFWRPVLVSALSEELNRASAQYGIDVFWKAYLSNRAGCRFGIPSVPLGELYSGVQAAIERRGGEVRFRATVREVVLEGDRVVALRLDDGSELRADAYISAVPQDALPALLPREYAARHEEFANLKNLQTSPITGVHFWFDRPVMQEPYLAVLDRTVQWIFNKTMLYPSCAGGSGQYLQLVISASHDLIAKSRQEIIELCRGELAEVLPSARTAELTKATVVKEVAATFSPRPDSEALRLGPDCAISNLFLAGDWTRTGWPATMEGAVRSGYRAAEAVLTAAGNPRKFLQPDLPAQGFCRAWAKHRSEQQEARA